MKMRETESGPRQTEGERCCGLWPLGVNFTAECGTGQLPDRSGECVYQPARHAQSSGSTGKMLSS